MRQDNCYVNFSQSVGYTVLESLSISLSLILVGTCTDRQKIGLRIGALHVSLSFSQFILTIVYISTVIPIDRGDGVHMRVSLSLSLCLFLSVKPMKTAAKREERKRTTTTRRCAVARALDLRDPRTWRTFLKGKPGLESQNSMFLMNCFST